MPIALLAACSPSESDLAESFTLKVEVAEEQPPIESLCIDDSCLRFEEDEAVRSAEHSVLFSEITDNPGDELIPYTAKLWGEVPSEGSTSGEDCALIEFRADGGKLFDVCP